MASKTETITLDKTFYSVAQLRKDYGNVFPEVIDTGKLRVNFDVEFPAPESGYNAKAIKSEADNVLAQIERQFNKQFEKAFAEIENFAAADKGGDSKAYSNAKGLLEKLNKYIEKYLKSLRVEVRKAMAAKLQVESKELSTVGAEEFDEFELRRGAFEADDFAAEGDNGYGELAAAIKQGQRKWHYCAVAANGTMAFVLVDRKKPVKRSEFKELKNDLGGSAVVLQGICYPKGQTVKFRLLMESQKQPHCVHLKDGLKTQIGKSFKVLPVSRDLSKLPSVSELKSMDENGKTKKDGKEKGEKGEKQKEK